MRSLNNRCWFLLCHCLPVFQLCYLLCSFRKNPVVEAFAPIVPFPLRQQQQQYQNQYNNVGIRKPSVENRYYYAIRGNNKNEDDVTNSNKKSYAGTKTKRNDQPVKRRRYFYGTRSSLESISQNAQAQADKFTNLTNANMNDVKNEVVWRLTHADYTHEDILLVLRIIVSVGLEFQPIAILLPSRALVNMLNISLAASIHKRVGNIVSKELERRIKKRVNLGKAFKAAVTAFTGKERYEHGDISNRFEEVTEAVATTTNGAPVNVTAVKLDEVLSSPKPQVTIPKPTSKAGASSSMTIPILALSEAAQDELEDWDDEFLEEHMLHEMFDLPPPSAQSNNVATLENKIKDFTINSNATEVGSMATVKDTSATANGRPKTKFFNSHGRASTSTLAKSGSDMIEIGSHKVQDMSKWVNQTTHTKADHFTHRKDAHLSDVKKEIVWRFLHTDYTHEDILFALRLIFSIGLEFQPIAMLLPSKVLVDMLNLSLAASMHQQVGNVVSKEIERRMKQKVNLGTAFKTAVVTFIGKEEYEHGDITRRHQEVAAAGAAAARKGATNGTTSKIGEVVSPLSPNPHAAKSASTSQAAAPVAMTTIPLFALSEEAQDELEDWDDEFLEDHIQHELFINIPKPSGPTYNFTTTMTESNGVGNNTTAKLNMTRKNPAPIINWPKSNHFYSHGRASTTTLAKSGSDMIEIGSHKVQDMSKWVNQTAHTKADHSTHRKDAHLSDVKKEIVWRFLHTDYTHEDILFALRLIFSIGLEFQPIAMLLPSKVLVDMLNLSLAASMHQQVGNVVSKEIERRVKKKIDLGVAFKSAIIAFTGKEEYEHGDITRRHQQVAAAAAASSEVVSVAAAKIDEALSSSSSSSSSNPKVTIPIATPKVSAPVAMTTIPLLVLSEEAQDELESWDDEFLEIRLDKWER